MTPAGRPLPSREWDAAAYHRISWPQRSWGLRVLERLELRRGEHVLDAGCGTGLVTSALHEKAAAAGGRVTAIDRSTDMTGRARGTLPAAVPVVAADLLALPFGRAFDVVFSTATFHWVPDQAGLYRSVAGVLAPGGRLHVQCGGSGNLERLVARAMRLAAARRFAARFVDWRPPWWFLAPDEAGPLLVAAGFTGIRAWLEPAPTPFPDRASYREFLERVVLGAWLARFGPGDTVEERAFVDRLCDEAAADEEGFTLAYVRLNLEATLGGAAR
jgi:trans-aconitate 2-methyltransferase